MSEYPSDSPVVTRPVCPGCEPDTELVGLVEIRYCHIHMPATAGLDDAGVRDNDTYLGSSDAGGADNIAWCAFFHRGRRSR